MEHIPSFKIVGIVIHLKVPNFKTQIMEALSFKTHMEGAADKTESVVVEVALKINITMDIQIKEHISFGIHLEVDLNFGIRKEEELNFRIHMEVDLRIHNLVALNFGIQLEEHINFGWIYLEDKSQVLVHKD